MGNPAYDRSWLMRVQPMLGPCAKQTVIATVERDGEIIATGTNSCRRPQPRCPRDERGMKTGEGYHLCHEICDQTGHAEVNALRAAGEGARGAIMRVVGHSYACEACKEAARHAGIEVLMVGGGFVRLNVPEAVVAACAPLRADRESWPFLDLPEGR